MTHIVIISTSFPLNNSGAEAAGSFVADFVQELSKFAQVTVLAPGYENKYEKNDAYNIQWFAVPRLPLSSLRPTSLVNWISILRTLNSGTSAITELHNNYPCDYILALWALPSGYWANYTMKKFGVPYSTWALGSDIWSLGKVPLVKNILKKVLQDSHYCFADGYTLKEDVETISQRNFLYLASSRQLTVSKKNNIAIEQPYNLAFRGRWHVN